MKIAPIQTPLVARLWVAEAERGMYVCEHMIHGGGVCMYVMSASGHMCLSI